MEDVHQDKLLVLLLMSQTKRDQIGGFSWDTAGEEAFHRGVHMGAVAQHIGRGGARQKSASGPRMPIAHRLIIRIEQVAEAGVEHLVAAQIRCENKRFEEPARVSEMPFHRTGVGHGLGLLVFG